MKSDLLYRRDFSITKQFFLALLGMLLLMLSAAAQNGEEENAESGPDPAGMVRVINHFITTAFESDPSGFFMYVLAAEESEPYTSIRKEFGITEEHTTHVQMTFEMAIQSEEFQEMQSVLDGIDKKFGSRNYDLTETELAAMDHSINFICDKANEATAAAFSPEQIQKMDAAILALSSGLESPFLNNRHMTALGMTDEQKKKFAEINEETKGDREKMIAGLTETLLSTAKNGKIEFKDLVSTLAKFKEFTRDLKKRRSAVLTAAQISKMKTLSRLPKALSVANLLPKWMPDADSWKPGDPVPEGLAPENKQTRPFPREE